MPFNLAGNLRNFRSANAGNFPNFQRLTERNVRTGEVATVLPPEGTDIINAQGHDITSDGKQLEITPQLMTLFRSGMIRIEPIPPGQKPGPELTAGNSSGTSSEKSGNTDAKIGVPDSKSTVPVEVSFLNLAGDDTIKTGSFPAFLSREEIRASTDWEGLRRFIQSKDGRENEKMTLGQLKEIALTFVEEKDNPFKGI